jgi:N4-gp56 family major capsid protein
METKFKFDLQRFADTTIPQELILKSWAKQAWEAGIHDAFFAKFMGRNARSIIQVKEDLRKGAGTSINIPLLLPLSGAGVWDDNILEGNEEALEYSSFDTYIHYIRHGVRLNGLYEEQKTQINMRRDAKDALAEWLSTFIDTSLFGVLTGVTPPFADANYKFPLTPPTADRIVYGGSASSEATIAAADTFTADLIGKAKRLATADENTAIRPINVNGHSTYVMVIDPFQARDLRNDPKWLEAQKHANVRGEKNPIFSGAMGMYDGVVIHEHNRVPRTATGASDGKVGHALFLGAQAAVFAEGNAPRWVEKKFDYENKYGVSCGRMFGLQKAQFKFDGTNYTDFGVINVLTSSVDD